MRDAGWAWLASWLLAAAIALAGVLLLYLNFDLASVGKGQTVNPALGLAPMELIAAGGLGIVVSTAGIARFRWQLRTQGRGSPNRSSDIAAVGGLTVAIVAFACWVLIGFGWPAASPLLAEDPCARNPVLDCFRAQPQFYQEDPPGSLHFTTPSSRLYDGVLQPVFLASWPAGLAAGLICLIALGARTNRPHIAIAGLVLGSAVVVGVAVLYLAFLVIGGGE